ncbi:MAG: DUF2027 domain-containing protein [Bacteroidales bacterium]
MSTINIGDRVKFLNSVGGGIVRGFQSKSVALVEDEDGFEVPTLVSELVKDNSGSYSATPQHDDTSTTVLQSPQAPEQEVYEPIIIEGNDKPNFFVAFVPTDTNNPVGGEIELFIINDSNYTLLFNYSKKHDDTFISVESGDIEPNTKLLIDSYSQSDLPDFPKLYFQIIPFLSESKELSSPFTKELVISPVKFYKEKSYLENDFFNEHAIIFSLSKDLVAEDFDKITQDEFRKVLAQKEQEPTPKRSVNKRKRTSELIEVDLHIHEILDDFLGLSNHEMLEIQLERFNNEMKDAIANKVRKIVFIHGVGAGKLKMEILNELKRKYAKYSYQDASFKEYGFGATMVNLMR